MTSKAKPPSAHPSGGSDAKRNFILQQGLRTQGCTEEISN